MVLEALLLHSRQRTGLSGPPSSASRLRDLSCGAVTDLILGSWDDGCTTALMPGAAVPLAKRPADVEGHWRASQSAEVRWARASRSTATSEDDSVSAKHASAALGLPSAAKA